MVTLWVRGVQTPLAAGSGSWRATQTSGFSRSCAEDSNWLYWDILIHAEAAGRHRRNRVDSVHAADHLAENSIADSVALAV